MLEDKVIRFMKRLLIIMICILCALSITFELIFALDTSDVDVKKEIATVREVQGPKLELVETPLDDKLMFHIFRVANDYDIDYELVISMIKRESNFRHCIMGDDGESKGLMQIQERWHVERMDRLGCDDLLNPYQNVLVGVDYLSELIDEGGLIWALMAYNGGPSYATSMIEQGQASDYVKDVLREYKVLKGEIENGQI